MSLNTTQSKCMPLHYSIQSGQGRIIHCAGCTMEGGPRCQGAPDQLPNFYHAVSTFECLNVQA